MTSQTASWLEMSERTTVKKIPQPLYRTKYAISGGSKPKHYSNMSSFFNLIPHLALQKQCILLINKQNNNEIQLLKKICKKLFLTKKDITEFISTSFNFKTSLFKNLVMFTKKFLKTNKIPIAPYTTNFVVNLHF